MPRKTDWDCIVRKSNAAWDADFLRGCELFEGEIIELEWPDGSHSRKTVHIEVLEKENAEPNGFRWKTYTHRAYVTCKVHGMRLKAYICVLKARRLNAPCGDRTKPKTKDLTGTVCKACANGTLAERSVYDDWDGMLTCGNCGIRHKRWS